jgi:predicted nuclease of predicted toxin-antitoxin system
MRFLADESCDFVVVRALRAEGHDVSSVAEVARGSRDSEVLRLAREDARVLLSEDKDFGRLVYAAGQGSLGVVLFRFPARAREALRAAALAAVSQLGERLTSSFVVVEPGRIRVSSTSPPSD